MKKEAAPKKVAAKKVAAKKVAAKAPAAKKRASRKAVANEVGAGKTRASSKRAAPAATTKPAGPARRAAKKPAAGQAAASSPAHAPIALDFSRFEITHPDRVLFPDQGITKRDLMLHYARVAPLMLPYVVGRPLMIVRCPEGAGKPCFHQKHPSAGMPKAVEQVMVEQKSGPEPNLMIRDVEGLFGLVQMGALEVHVWGCRAERLDAPDQLVFDIDPDEGLPWERVMEAAHALRTSLAGHGLTGFLRLTGGKGLHVVTPVTPSLPWDEAKRFSKAVADALVEREPSKYLSTMNKQKRKGKIFLDYLRNGAGATAVCSYSTRARAGAPLAVPIEWDELDETLRSDSYDVKNLARRLAEKPGDPWPGFEEARAPIPK